ncbi:MAG: hypothetical protein CMI54_08160 [Parcubacteria group bacterium]|jgi:hypothetical protein|nr:hypothetical protein [Parcubacteria group bacterium]|tara:strand:- start:5714 stop:6511 length:798 start_codon:yes stop_codon:yes gene_type:complete
MAYSGTRTFNLSAEEIIEEAFERCGLEVRMGYDLKTARRSLNLMLSEWANRGLNLWTVDYFQQTLTAGTNNYAVDQRVVDILDATITTTAYDATDSTPVSKELASNSATTDVNVTKISRTEYMNLSRKTQTSSGDARPTQFTLISGVSTYSDITDISTPTSGRPENDMRLYLYPNPDKAYVFKYFFINRIEDVGSTNTGYQNSIDVPFMFLPCLTAGLAYYISVKRAPMLSANLKAMYDEEFDRAADTNRERVSFRVKPAQAYIP